MNIGPKIGSLDSVTMAAVSAHLVTISEFYEIKDCAFFAQTNAIWLPVTNSHTDIINISSTGI